MERNGLICFILLWIVSACNAALSCGLQIPHGDVTWWCDTPPCPYSCHEGYKEHDKVSWLDCSTSGQWVSSLWYWPVSPKDLCTPKPCLTVIPNGAFSGACQAVVGSTCNFSCEAGYRRNMSVSELTCQNSTEWSPDLRSLCLRPDGQQCPYYIPRGYLNFTCIREPGQTCNFTCDEGYQPSISPSTIACGSNLEWNHNPEILCQEIICPKLFEGGYVSERCSRKYKATCYDFQCNPGYIKRAVAYYVKCDESGKWIFPFDVSPACVNLYNMSSSSTFRTTSPAATSTSLFPTLSCGMQIPHGDVTGWCLRQGDLPCTYSCHKGYKKHNTVSWLKCSTSGQWVTWFWNPLVSAKDLCTPKPCHTVISKGAFSESCQAVVGSTCSFSCEAGYMRNTSVFELTCQTSTEWSADLRSLCLRPDGQQCPYYIPRGYLNLTCIREPGQTCNFTCDEGYQPSISPSSVACGSNLEWNHNPESLCQETICPKLFEGGYVSEYCSRKYKETCYDFQCNPGYIKRAVADYVKCDKSGKWIDPYIMSPGCVKIDDLCPLNFTGGYFTYWCCNYECYPGYVRNSSSMRMYCLQNRTWTVDTNSLCIQSGNMKTNSYSPDLYNTSSSRTFRTTSPAATTSTSLFPTLWTSKPYFNDGRGGNGNLGTIVGTTVGAVTGILIIFLFIGWIVKRSSVRKSQRRETGGVGSGCLRPRENPLQDITTIRQQFNANGMGSVSSFESPIYNGIYVHPNLQGIPTVSSSCYLPDPPPSYSKTLIGPNEAPPTYEEVVSDHSRFNLYN